jgi:hypothetical protein
MNARSDCGEPIDGASSPSKIPIADVLSRAGHELAHIAWLLENFQTHLSPLIQEAAARDQNALHQMQSFDHIGQITAASPIFWRHWRSPRRASGLSIRAPPRGPSCSRIYPRGSDLRMKQRIHAPPHGATASYFKLAEVDCVLNTARRSRFRRGGRCRDRPPAPVASHLRRRRNPAARCRA